MPPARSVFGHVETSAFTARERSDDLLLISALEVEAAEISTARHLKLTDFQNVQTVGNRFPNGLVVLGEILWSEKPR